MGKLNRDGRGKCLLCEGKGKLRVWKKKKLTGKLYSVDEVCACVRGLKNVKSK